MFLKPYIHFPYSNDFTEIKIEEICEALGGNVKTLSCSYTNEKEIEHASFAVSLKQKEYELISGDCTKFMHVSPLCRPLYERNMLVEFTCIVTLSSYSRMLLIHDAMPGKDGLITKSVALYSGKPHLSFFENKRGHSFNYHFYLPDSKPRVEVTVFKFTPIPQNKIRTSSDEFSDN